MAVSTSPPADLSAALVLEPVAAADWLVILPVAWCLAIGALLVMLRRPIGLHPFISVAGLAGLVVIDALLLQHVIVSGPVTMVMGRWLPPFGIAFTVDLTGALFALAASVVALAGGVYSLSDINDSGRRYGFYPFLMLLMAGVSGAFLTGDIFNLYVWFEVLLISSFGLIVLGSEREQIDGAVKYGFLNLVATTLFLVTTGYLYASFGTLNMADIARKAEGLRGTAPLMTLTALFLLAFGMKAAAFPVNFWLPASYHTPRVVVSALFAGLLTKVGIYALIRVTVMLLPMEREELSFVIAVVGALTMLVGVFGALAQSDFRRMLGYLVISGIGSILAGIAVGGPGGHRRRDLLRSAFDACHDRALLRLGRRSEAWRQLLAVVAFRSLPPPCGLCRDQPDARLCRVRPAAVLRLLAEGHAGQGSPRHWCLVARSRTARHRLPDDDRDWPLLPVGLLAGYGRRAGLSD